jgi:hypothetical protein
VTFPWSGGVAHNGTNTSGVSLFSGNVTIPAADPDLAGFNYTLGISASSSNCVFGTAQLSNGGGIWKFYWAFDPVPPQPPAQGWIGHLAPGDTYQLVLNLTGSTFEALLYNVTMGHVWSGGPPDLAGMIPDPALSLFVGPSVCNAHPTSLTAGLVVRASTLAGGGLDRDYFVQDEAIVVGRGTNTSEIPNLWQPYFNGAPYDFAPEQGWSTSSLVTLTTDHPANSAIVTTAPPTAIDVGQAVGVGVVGKPATLPGAANTNTYEIPQIEFAGYAATGPLTFATCESQNGTTPPGKGDPGSDTGVKAEYDYASNSTPALSDIYYAYEQDPATNSSIDLRCYTPALATPGYLDVFSLAYLQYDVPTGIPSQPVVDALSSGPREILGMNAYFWNVTVNPLPSLTLMVVPSKTVEVGETATFTATLTGGTAPFSYTWYVDGVAQGSCATNTCGLSWGAIGSHQVWAGVVDAEGNRAVSAHTNETVVAILAAAVAPYPTAVGSVGTPVTFTGSGTGGSGGYGYEFWTDGAPDPLGITASGTSSWTPASPGVYQEWVDINDSNNDWAASPHTNLTVANALVASLSPALSTIEVGGAPATYTASAAGGAGPYTYAWSFGALTPTAPCTSTTCTLTTSTAGSYQVWVVATDSAGRVAASPHANLTVVNPPSFVSWSGPVVVDAGSTDVETANFQAGDAPFSYGWTLGAGAVPSCSGTPSCALPFGAVGNFWINVTLVDALGGSAYSTPLEVRAVPALTLSMTPSPLASAEVGVQLGLTATAGGGAGGDAFGFLTSAAPSVPFWTGSASFVNWIPATAGAFQVWAEANDSTGFRVVSTHTNVTVAAPLAISLSPAPTAFTSVDVALPATATLTGGVAPTTVRWFSDGTLTSCNGDSCSFSWSAVGEHVIWATAGDALGVVVASSHTNVTVAAGAKDTVQFVISPPDGGRLVVDGNVTLSGSVSLPTGTHSLQAVAYRGFSFVRWVASPSNLLSVAGPTAASTSVQVTGNGTIIEEFAGSYPLSLTLVVSGGPGNILFNGTEEASGSSVSLPAGLYPIAGAPGTGYVFLGWTSDSSDITTLNNSASTSLELGANGTLTLHETLKGATSSFSIGVATSPSSVGGDFTIEGIVYHAGASAPAPVGTFSLSFSVGSSTAGYTFQSWQTTGGVSVASSTSASTQITVTGNGTLTAVLVSGQTPGPLGLSAQTFDVLLVLLVILAVLVLLGIWRHQRHHRNTQVRPPPGRGTPPPAAEGSEAPFDDLPPGT